MTSFASATAWLATRASKLSPATATPGSRAAQRKGRVTRVFYAQLVQEILLWLLPKMFRVFGVLGLSMASAPLSWKILGCILSLLLAMILDGMGISS